MNSWLSTPYHCTVDWLPKHCKSSTLQQMWFHLLYVHSWDTAHSSDYLFSEQTQESQTWTKGKWQELRGTWNFSVWEQTTHMRTEIGCGKSQLNSGSQFPPYCIPPRTMAFELEWYTWRITLGGVKAYAEWWSGWYSLLVFPRGF